MGRESQHFVMIGGGHGGLTTAVNLHHKWKCNPEVNFDLKITIIDPSHDKKDGYGPFRNAHKALYSNTPVGLTNPYIDGGLTYHFPSFATTEAYDAIEYDRDSCFPRNFFGRFQEKEYAELERQDELDEEFTFKKITATATGLKRDIPNGQWQITVEGTDVNFVNADQVLVSLGPQRRPLPPAIDPDAPKLIRNQYDFERMNNIVVDADTDSDLPMAGFGSTTIDTIAVMEHMGYKGRYSVYGPKRRPWAINSCRILAQSGGNRYEHEFLTLEEFGQNLYDCYKNGGFNRSAKSLIAQTIQDELDNAEFLRNSHAQALNIDTYRFKMEWCEAYGVSPTDIDVTNIFNAFKKNIQDIANIITAPEQIEMLERVNASGRITYIPFKIDLTTASYDGESQKFKYGLVSEPDNAEVVMLSDAFAIGAPYRRHVLTVGGNARQGISKILRNMRNYGYVRGNETNIGVLDPNKSGPGIHLGWHETHDQVWGIGVSAKHYDSVAEAMLRGPE